MNQRAIMRRIAFRGLMAAALSHVALTAAENPNLAPQAAITASVKADPAAAVADGLVPAAGSRNDRGNVWKGFKPEALPASLVFAWPEPVTVSTVV